MPLERGRVRVVLVGTKGQEQAQRHHERGAAEGARARSRCRPEGEEESEAQDEALDPLGTERQEGPSDRKTKQ